MKKTVALCIIVLLVVMSVASSFGCQQQAALAPPPAQTPKPTIGSLIYTNSEHGFSVEYPTDWNLEENLTEQEKFTGIVIKFLGPLPAEYDNRAVIIIEADKLPSEFTAEEYAEVVEIRILKKNLPDYVNLEEQTTVIGGVPSLMRTFTATMQDAPHKDIQAYFTKENVGYAITYDVTIDSHDKYVGCFELVTSTFKFE